MPDHSTPSHTIPPPPDVTVVVPTKNAARTLAACLQSLRSQTHPCRTVVVDNGSTDSTRAIAEDGADAVLEIGPERSAQRNHGARTYPAEFVGFIDADMVLQPTVVAEAVAALRAGAGSVIVPERTVGSGFWVEVRAFERSFYDGSDAIEAARFFRWDVFDRAGGFDEQLTGPEDWDLSESARELAPVARTAAVIEHDEGTIGYLDACRKKAYYAEGVRRYVAKRGVSALRQAGRRPWVRHPQGMLNRRGAGVDCTQGWGGGGGRGGTRPRLGYSASWTCWSWASCRRPAGTVRVRGGQVVSAVTDHSGALVGTPRLSGPCGRLFENPPQVPALAGAACSVMIATAVVGGKLSPYRNRARTAPPHQVMFVRSATGHRVAL